MDELTARAALVSAPDLGEGVSTSIPRSEIEDVLRQDELPIELHIDVTRFADGEAGETRTVAVSWERDELERLLQQAQGDAVVLTFDGETLRQAMEADVEAHGLREKALILAVAATAAAGGATAASAEPGAYLGAGAPITQMSPDDRAVPRGGPVETPALAPDDRAVPRSTPAPTATPGVVPDDRAVPRGGPVETPSLSPDDRAVPFSSPEATPTPAPSVSPDDRAFPRGGPVETPAAGNVSDPGITFAPSPTETVAVIGALALAITGAFFVVGGRRRMRIGPA